MRRVSRQPARFEGGQVHFDVSTAAHTDTWAIVDEADWPRLHGRRWSATKRANALYVRNGVVGLLHRFLLDPDPSLVVDHRDGNPLNNSRTNIRICTQELNNQNGADRKRGHSILVEKVATPTAPHVVTRRLADGSTKAYTYPTRSKEGTKTAVRVKYGPIR
jgi:hypothetical protein